jgi:hypothetical protein
MTTQARIDGDTHKPSIRDNETFTASDGREVRTDVCGVCQNTIYWSETMLAWFVYSRRYGMRFVCGGQRVVV